MGEFGLIARIERAVDRAGGSAVRLGIGDDAALLRLRSGEELAVSTDAFVEGVHFRYANESPRTIGRRAIAASLSDLAAMGARPVGCVVALAAPPSLPLARFDGLAAGMAREAAHHGAPLCGGNLTRARQTAISVTVLGAVRSGRALTRKGSRPGDRILVTGRLGRAALERARAERAGGRVRHVPEPRIAAGRKLAGLGARIACIDVSDGLAADLRHLLGTGLGADLDPEALPLARGVAGGARRLGLDPHRLALTGGEDYELLFTLPPGRPGREALARRLGVEVSELGTVVRRRRGQQPGKAGWRHF